MNASASEEIVRCARIAVDQRLDLISVLQQHFDLAVLLRQLQCSDKSIELAVDLVCAMAALQLLSQPARRLFRECAQFAAPTISAIAAHARMTS